MKKIITLLLACCLLLSGCGKPQSDGPRLIRVGFSQVGSESDWRIANTISMVEVFSEPNGYELIFDNAMQKQENQLLAIRNFIQQEVDYIVLAPISEYGWDDVLREAKDAGIPVIIMDRQIQVEDDSLYACCIGSDFYAEGRTAAAWLEEKLRDRGEEEIRILHIQGTENSTAQLSRTKALQETAARHKNWNIVAELDGDFIEAKSYELVRDFLRTGQRIDVIYSENDNMTFGAIRALEEKGVAYGPGGDVTIISFDAVRSALEYCMDGKIDLCVECNPLQGPRVAEIIRGLEQGIIPPKKNFVDEVSFTPGMLTQELIEARSY